MKQVHAIQKRKLLLVKYVAFIIKSHDFKPKDVTPILLRPRSMQDISKNQN
jgi:hypothetical protein